ncbi:SPOSA6832_00978, partial [Sporobolomyces salmonicolor]
MGPPRSPIRPACKKPRMNEPSTRSGIQTRAQTAAAPASLPSGNHDYDDDYDDPGFEYDSDLGSVGDTHEGMDVDEDDDLEVIEQSGFRKNPVETLEFSDEESVIEDPPPEPSFKPKGKLTARKQLAVDVVALTERYGSSDGEIIKGAPLPLLPPYSNHADQNNAPRAGLKRDEGDDMIRFSLVHPDYPHGLKLSLMFPELGGYPNSHDSMCFSENENISPQVEAIMAEIAQYDPSHLSLPKSSPLITFFRSSRLPKHADRSLNGIIEYLIHRIVRGEPSPFANQQQSQGNETDEEGFDYDEDDLIGQGPRSGEDSEMMKALRRQGFHPTRLSSSGDADRRPPPELVKAGYRPGFARVSELDLVVSVSKKARISASQRHPDLSLTLGPFDRSTRSAFPSLITGEVAYLVLLMNFGSKYPVDLDNMTRGEVQFRVGISRTPKPSKAAIASAFRSHSANAYTKGEFQAISLSAPLDSLFLHKFQEILLIRRRDDKCGWAAAEQHCLGGRVAGEEEEEIASSHNASSSSRCLIMAWVLIPLVDVAKQLPKDPMGNGKVCNNYPLLAFSYLVRRFVMCPRFCLICFKCVDWLLLPHLVFARRCDETFTALKPFVCDSSLCLFQLISLGLGPSLEHEIVTNASAVDLLVQLAYVGAKEGGLRGDLLPNGLSLEVPKDKLDGTWVRGDQKVDFDTLPDDSSKCAGVAALILELPPINEMKIWLTGEDLSENDRMLSRNRKLSDIRDGTVSSSAIKLLRWIVVSNTSYLKQIEENDELIQGVPKEYRQFRLVVGSPSKEHLLAENVKAAQTKDKNALKFGTLFAWHGSSVKNWHSILRQGLHFRETINGRAFGHGVYFASDGSVSLGHYSTPSSITWANADFGVGKMAAVCEIVNLPKEFVSKHPYLVVKQLEWIQCRYLVIQRGVSYSYTASDIAKAASSGAVQQNVKTLPLDPAHPLLLNGQPVKIPDVVDKLERIEQSLEDTPEDLNASDSELLKVPSGVLDAAPTGSPGDYDGGGRLSKIKLALSSIAGGSSLNKEVEEKKPDTFECADGERLKLIRMLPPPNNPSRSTVATLQREMKEMMALQEKEGPIAAGFYFDPERSNDNLFTWVIEIPQASFHPDLPLANDMKLKGVKSLLMEIRFSENFPFSPPFFRVVHPRFLPFIHGGGGHVTGGGSICMDLLTTDGWSSVYTIDAILLQIRMAMSNLEPKPGRLDPHHWNTPYAMDEAVAGFKRAAATHGWAVPPELAEMTRQY